jgi:hypothetical protein
MASANELKELNQTAGNRRVFCSLYPDRILASWGNVENKFLIPSGAIHPALDDASPIQLYCGPQYMGGQSQAVSDIERVWIE